MTNEDLVVKAIEGMIESQSQDYQDKVKEYEAKINNLLEEGGEPAQMALALVGAKAASAE